MVGSEVCREEPKNRGQQPQLPMKAQIRCPRAGLSLVLKLQSVSPCHHCHVKLYIHFLPTWYSSPWLQAQRRLSK